MIKTSMFLTALLALPFMGSASLRAQTADPFGPVNDGKYSNSMNITGYVRFITWDNDQWVPVDGGKLGNGTVVAVYQGDELRGKGSTSDFLYGEYKSLLMLTVFGDTNGQPLHYKVFIPSQTAGTGNGSGQESAEAGAGAIPEGRVIEFDPDTLSFSVDARLGSADLPYYINVPMPVTTTFSSEGWATTCLPFDAEVPDGVTLWTATGIESGELIMNTVEVPASGASSSGLILPKDTPVILQATEGTDCEWLSAVIDKETLAQHSSLFTSQQSLLKGTTAPTEVVANSVLTLGHSNETGEIGFWLFTKTTVPANRAYIADFPAGTRGVRLSSTSSIGEKGIVDDVKTAAAVYDLQGRQVNTAANSSLITSHSSLKKGIYVIHGKKFIIK